MRSRLAGVTVLAASVLVTAACGTRLPDSAFQSVAQGGSGDVQGGTSDGSSGVGGTGATGSTTGGSRAGGGLVGGSSGTAGTAGSRGTKGGGSRGGAGAQGGGGSGAAGNTASDIGVTPTTITIGNVSSISNAFDPNAFRGPLAGAQAFFHTLNARGGVHGRKILLQPCDDKGSGDQNQTCVHNLIDTTKVFGFVANAVFDYSAASYVNSMDRPDIGGQPISTFYDQYPHFYSIYGVNYPRNGKTPGYNGYDYNGTEVYRWMKTRFKGQPLKAAVVYYNQSASARYAAALEAGLRKEGCTVDDEQVNFAFPDFGSAVVHMQSQQVKFVFDVLDSSGNQNLCDQMDAKQLYVDAKVTTTQGWVSTIGQDYRNAPRCRNSLYATSETRNFEDTSQPVVPAFRAAMAAAGFGDPTSVDYNEWALEGYGAAQWFTDAVASCGAKVTRACVEGFMDHRTYNAHGLFDPRGFRVIEPPPSTVHNCINVAHWSDKAGGWVTDRALGDTHTVPGFSCFDVPYLPYRAS